MAAASAAESGFLRRRAGEAIKGDSFMRTQGKHGRSKQVLSAFAAVVALGLSGVGGGVALAADADEADLAALVVGGEGDESGAQDETGGGQVGDDLALDGADGGDGAGGDDGQAVVDPADESDGLTDSVGQGDSERSGEAGLAATSAQLSLLSAPLVHSLGDESVDVADFCDAGTVPEGVT